MSFLHQSLRIVILAVFVGVSCMAAAASLKISGVDSKVEDNVRLHSASFVDSYQGNNLDEIREILQPQIQAALQAFGYYQSQLNYSVEDEELEIEIEAGEPVRWRDFELTIQRKENSLEGSTVAEEKIFIVGEAGHPFELGQRLNHKVFDDYKRNMLARAQSLGYMDARYESSRLEINTNQLIADVKMSVDLGERYYVRDVEFLGSRIDQKLLHDLAEVKTGKSYSANDIGSIYNNLANCGYFASIDITTEKVSPNQVVLRVNLVDQPSHRISTGVGFGTDTGPRLRVKWQRPALNSSGHSQSTELQLSEVLSEITTQYRIPWDHPLDRYVSWNSGYQIERTDEVKLQIVTTGLSYNRVLKSGNQYSFQTGLESEKAERGDAEPTTDTYVLLGANWLGREYRGDATDPDMGYKYWVNFIASHKDLGSDANFYRAQAGISGLIKFWERHSLVMRMEVGKVFTNDFFDVPVSQRYFTGGDHSLRGFEYETVAPRDAEDNLVGGQLLNTNSLEYRYQWSKSWQTAIFTDWGRSYLDPDINCDTCVDRGTDERRSAGVGVRWKSPVGMISLDVAKPIDSPMNLMGEPLYQEEWRFHLYLGSVL